MPLGIGEGLAEGIYEHPDLLGAEPVAQKGHCSESCGAITAWDPPKNTDKALSGVGSLRPYGTGEDYRCLHLFLWSHGR
jgi:hypothetical protein